MARHIGIGDSPYVIYPQYLTEENKAPSWRAGCEENFLLVLEAHRRFLLETQDPSLASALTLAWATLVAEPRE